MEFLWLLKARPEAAPEQLDELLDSLWSLQYMIPAGILCASAGPVVGCVAYSNLQQAQQQQQQQVVAAAVVEEEQQEAVAATAGSVEEQQQWQCGFTHAVHFRLANRTSLEHLLTHPLMGASRDAVSQLCASASELVFEGLVARRLEALFRRGQEYEAGVEHLLLLQAQRDSSDGGAVGVDAFLHRMAGLAESSVAGGIQASHGALISCVHAAATHVLMTRFAALPQVQQLLDTPACAAVVAGDPRVPVAAVGSLCVSIQPTEESTQVDGQVGGGGFGGGGLPPRL